jgi:hypothetical protein
MLRCIALAASCLFFVSSLTGCAQVGQVAVSPLKANCLPKGFATTVRSSVSGVLTSSTHRFELDTTEVDAACITKVSIIMTDDVGRRKTLIDALPAISLDKNVGQFTQAFGVEVSEPRFVRNSKGALVRRPFCTYQNMASMTFVVLGKFPTKVIDTNIGSWPLCDGSATILTKALPEY